MEEGSGYSKCREPDKRTCWPCHRTAKLSTWLEQSKQEIAGTKSSGQMGASGYFTDAGCLSRLERKPLGAS